MAFEVFFLNVVVEFVMTAVHAVHAARSMTTDLLVSFLIDPLKANGTSNPIRFTFGVVAY